MGCLTAVCLTSVRLPNQDSILRLVTAILSEISDEWETGNTYLQTNKT